MTEWIAELEALGPFRVAALRFVSEHDAPRLDPGAPALAWLARVLDSFDAASPAMESRFVEGAAAFLAAVLAGPLSGRHAERGGEHRLRVGSHGYFDPFRAIERALDAEGAKRSLVIDVDRAEREAAGVAGVGRVAKALEARLAAERPDVVWQSHFEHLVLLRVADESLEVDVARVLRAVEGEPDSTLDRSLSMLLRLLPGGGGEGTRWEEVCLPRIVGPSFATHAGLAAAPWLGELSVALVVPDEGRARFVAQAEVERSEAPLGAHIERAIERLGANSSAARFRREGELVLLASRDGLDAARVLVPSVRAALRELVGAEGVQVGIPHRDLLIACDAGDARAVEVLGARTMMEFSRAPHAISARLVELPARRVDTPDRGAILERDEPHR